MQQFKALFCKEISGYFQSYFAYAILFVYLFASIGSAFYFGAYLSMHDTAVYALFYLQPVILVLLLPAITMKLWSEEYKSGTAEFLLTQPLEFAFPVLAKFAAAVLFVAFMSLFLLPFIGYTAQYLSIDWGSVICSYAGLWLIIILFCALGVFMSALNKHIIAAYLLSVFVMALWLALPLSKLYETYTSFLLAEISLGDVVYFVLFSVVLIFLNVLFIKQRGAAQKHKMLKFSVFAALLLIGVAACNLALNLLLAHKYDLTAHKIYTPRAESREIIAKITQPTNIDVYIAKDFRAHNVEYFRYYQQVKRFLEKYQRLSGKMIRVNVLEVEPFSQMEKVVLGYGLYYEENLNSTKDYFGAVVRDNNGNGVIIKQFAVERGQYLEKDVDAALLKLFDDGKLSKTIGVYLDNTQDLDNFNGFMLNLEEDYHVINVEPDVYEISPQMDLLILVNPKLLSRVLHYAVDQYILNGGKVLILYDLLTKNQSDFVNMQMLSVVDFLDKWGILLDDKFVDSGKAATEFYQEELPLNLYRATRFSVINKKLKVVPIIESDEKYVGAIIKGILPSLYQDNPYRGDEMMRSMIPHSLYSINDSEVAVIGDADLIDDEFWLDERSADKNPYSAVNKAANAELVRNVVDYLLGVDAYRNLPVRTQYKNTQSIGQKIYEKSYAKYISMYMAVNDKINELKTQLLLKKDGQNVAAAQEEVRIFGEEITELEKEADLLLYKMKEEYAANVRKMLWLNLVLLPLSAVVLVWLAVYIVGRRRKKYISEVFSE